MVMRAMRDSAKWVMLILALAFVGWLVLDWVQSRTAGAGADPNPVVGVVAGRDIRLSQWNLYLENYRQQARAQRSDPLTEEESRQVREAAWETLVGEVLIQEELDRIGIEVSDEEIRQAFRTSPPPEFQSHPAFQTEGRFDPAKYRQYFASPTVDENLLLQLETYYRDRLPRIKLQRQVAAGVYVTEDEAWNWYRDRNETAEVEFVSLDPQALVADADVSVTEEEIRAYYRSHREEFARPATAVVDLVSLPAGPSPADSAAARSEADSLRRAIAAGETSFEEAAEGFSADSASAAEGGELGWIRRGELVTPVERAAFELPIGQLSEPVESSFGYHLMRVDERAGDSLSLRHILIPVEMSRETEDALFDRIDALEAPILDPEVAVDLATAAEELGHEPRRDVTLTRESDFIPGAGSLGVAVDWAFDPTTEPGDLSPFFENATGFHVVELQNREPAGTHPLERVEGRIRTRLLEEKRAEAARALLEEARRAMEGGESLEAVAAGNGWSVERAGPFTRVDFVAGLGQGTEAIGAAFGLPLGVPSPVLAAESRLVILRVRSRNPADRATFEARKGELMANLTVQRRQEYVQRWLDGLRERAEVQDLREQVSAQRAETAEI